MVWSVGGGELLRSNKPQGQRDPLQVTSQEFPPHVDLTHGEIFFFFFFTPPLSNTIRLPLTTAYLISNCFIQDSI